MAFARERELWQSLEFEDPSTVRIQGSSGTTGSYRIDLADHLEAIRDETTFLASVLIHSYALAESAASEALSLQSSALGGIEVWGGQLLARNGHTWSDVYGGLTGAVEVAVIRNVLAHGGRTLDAAGASRLAATGSTSREAGSPVELHYDELFQFRSRLRSLLRYGGISGARATT